MVPLPMLPTEEKAVPQTQTLSAQKHSLHMQRCAAACPSCAGTQTAKHSAAHPWRVPPMGRAQLDSPKTRRGVCQAAEHLQQCR